MRKMTGPERVGGAMILGVGLAKVGAMVWSRVQDYRTARNCPHPDHRIYSVMEYWCAECESSVMPIPAESLE